MQRTSTIAGGGLSAKKDNSDRESSGNSGPPDAEKPFDASAKADVILRSSDSVDFFVLKAILCLASPVFDNMFSIAQESKKGESTIETKNGLPVVDLEEDNTTLYDLLPLLYPYAKEPTDTLEVYTRVAEAAQKYAMDETLQKLKKLVMTCGAMVEEPVATFSVAMHFGWVEVMRKAALNTLAIPISDLVSGDKHSKYLHFIGVLDKLFTSWILRRKMPQMGSELPDIHMRRTFGPHLLKRLKESGCAQSTVLMDDRFVSDGALKSISFSDRELMMKDIENVVSKVPLKINGIVVQAGD